MNATMQKLSSIVKSKEESPLFLKIMEASTVGEILDLNLSPEDIIPLFYTAEQSAKEIHTIHSRSRYLIMALGSCPSMSATPRRIFI
mgnify:FL=1